jgi:hypothetical protein
MASGTFDSRAWRSLPARDLARSRLGLTVARRRDEYAIRFRGAAEFVLRSDGPSLVGYRHPGTSADLFRHLLIDQALPLVLSHSGRIVLHASACAVRERGLVFLGPSGAGKSTLAAALATSGATVVADDALVVREGRERLHAVPAYPGLRMWPDALAASRIAGRPARLASMRGKQRVSDTVGAFAFSRRAAPIASVYVLNAKRSMRAGIGIEPLPAREALIELVRHSFVLDIADRRRLAEQFDRLVRTLSCVDVKRLTYPRRFGVLPQVRAAILEDAGFA